MKVDEGDSPIVIRSDFFLKSSEKRKQQTQQDENVSGVLLEEYNDSYLSPNSTPSKRTPRKQKRKADSPVEERKKKTTPNKKVANGGPKEPCSKKTQSEILLDAYTLQSIPNLRLEAKMSAVENSRLLSGKQLHPFFSSLKSSKKNQEIIDLENTCCPVERTETSLAFKPIHVFDVVEDDGRSLDWGTWLLSERNSLCNCSDLEIDSSSVYNGLVNPLQFDDIPIVSCPAFKLKDENEIPLDECHNTPNKDCPVDSIEGCSSSISFKSKWQGHFLPQSFCNQLENPLWASKFQPRKAAQICGNSDSVKLLKEWLSIWHYKGFQASKGGFHDVNEVGQDTYQSDRDSELVDDEICKKNVLLVTGPVGSGKSAAIYACAEEQGFQIIEVNASDWRNGAIVKQRFGEALESHGLQRKVDDTINSEKNPLLESCPEFIEVNKGSSVSDKGLQLSGGMPSKSTCEENKALNTQIANKTLILFEDVDVILSENNGFLSTIQQLAKTAKRPMILTANSYNPILPSNLERLELSFGIPSSKELFGLGHVVCEEEKAKVHPWLIDRIIESCQGDIRKTIMHLQFWCQGQSSRKGNVSRISYDPLPFDLEAGHQILPKLIPWDCPSRLSEIVEEEITKTLTMMEERNSLIEIVVEEDLTDGKPHETLGFHDGVTDFIDAKKEAMLSLHCSNPTEDDLLAPRDCTCETSNSSRSRVAFSRQTVCRKLDSVISSDPEEESLGGSVPELFNRVFCDQMQDAKSSSPSHLFTIGQCCHQTDGLGHIEVDIVWQTCIGCSANGTHPQIDGLCTSIDMSSVPESSFVPETEVFSAAVSSSFNLDKQEEISMSNNVLANSIIVEVEKCPTSLVGRDDILVNGCDVGGGALHREDVGDSNLEHAADVIRGFPILDECSRIDFTRGLKNLENLSSHVPGDSIEVTWRRPRDCSMDLHHYVNPEEKDALEALEVASRMCNLISESDLLLSSCEPQICDSLDPSLLLSESSQLCCQCDDHLHMSSIVAQHGICFYTKKTVALGSKRGCLDRVNLAWEMLSSSTNKMALGKLLSLDSEILDRIEMGSQISCNSLRREMDLSLCNMLQSLVPTRAHLSMRGEAFHDYLSSLSKMSKLESTHLSEEASVRKHGRARAARHYLSSGTCALSPEDISLLSQHSCYQKLLRNQDIQSLG